MLGTKYEGYYNLLECQVIVTKIMIYLFAQLQTDDDAVLASRY